MMRTILTLLIIFVISKRSQSEEATFVINFIEEDMAIYPRTFYFGTHLQELLVQFSLNTPEISLFDSDCKNNYGSCRKYCDVAPMDRFCSPLCKFPTSMLQRRCTYSNTYNHTSEKLKISDEHWISPNEPAYGLWAEDEIHLRVNKTTTQRLGVVDIGLILIQTFTQSSYYFTALGKIGLGRHPYKENFVQLLKNNKLIDRLSLTITMPQVVFGSLTNVNCELPWKEVDALGEREWMFGAQGVAFFYFKAKHDFKIILTENAFVYMLRDRLLEYTKTGVLSKMDSEYSSNSYQINETKDLTQYQFEFTIDSHFALKFELSDLVDEYADSTTIFAEALDPNPDLVEWGLGTMMFRKYCVGLDYEKSKIRFANLNGKY